MSKCKGCGITLQTSDNIAPGYTPKKDAKLCERCFKITNYNYHEKDSKKIDNMDIIRGINQRKCTTLFLCDILNLTKNMVDIYNVIDGEKVFVVTKCDVIPKNIKIEKLASNIQNAYGIKDIMFVSTLSGYGKNNVLDYVDKHNKVLFVGPTSSGKSSLINYLFGFELTVSNYKNTTQEFVSLKVGNSVVIDAPGFNEEDMFDNSKQNGYINPKTVMVKKGYSLVIDKFEIAFDEDTNVTTVFPKNIIINSKKTKNNNLNVVTVGMNNDLVLNNLGFIYFKNGSKVRINDLNFETRLSLIGGAHE